MYTIKRRRGGGELHIDEKSTPNAKSAGCCNIVLWRCSFLSDYTL
jgi:hypothetical protein